MKLLDGLFVYPWTSLRDNNANSYVIDGPVPTVIDVGHSRHVNRLFQTMEQDGINRDRITLVVSTHLHPDHHEGVAAFSDKETLVTFHEEEARHLKEFGYQLYQAAGLRIPDVEPQFFLEEGTLTLGADEFDMYHTPGHSPGSICLYWSTKKVLFSGDVLFLGGVGRTDFYEGDGSLLKQSITKLSQLDVEYLLPGHGRIVEGKANIRENFRWIQEEMFPLL